MTEKEVKIQQERIEKFNKLKRELTPYKDMIESIDNLSKSSEKLVIGVTKDKFYIYNSNCDNVVAIFDYDEEKINFILDTVKELLENKYNTIKEDVDNV